MARQRLFYVLDSLAENEEGDQVATLLGRLPRSRFEPRVVGLGTEGPLESRIRGMAVTVHRMDLKGGTGTFLAVPRLRRVLTSLRADIVHTFQPWSDTVVQLSAPRSARIFRSVRGFTADHRGSAADRVRGWLERRAARLRPRSLVVADEVARLPVQHGYRAERIEVVPECVDLAGVRAQAGGLSRSDARLRLGMSDGDRAVAAFSDFHDARRLELLLEGFATARVERPGLRLFLVGGGPEEGSAKWHAEHLHVGDDVVFLGPSADRAGLLRACEVAVDACNWPGWSRGAVEAMATELPVLRWVDDSDGVARERFRVRTAAPPERFARDLITILDDGAARDAAIRTSVQEAQPFDVATVADRWSALYLGHDAAAGGGAS